jgi:hypothetical protein
METWITPTTEGSVNTIKVWKGAVQPAETGASGNEIKLWKGAIEPAAPTPTPSMGGDYGIVRGIVRGIVQPIVRGVA